MPCKRTTLRSRPTDTAELQEAIRTHAGALEPVGHGSKRLVGKPVVADLLDLSRLTGVVDYSAAELVLTARAATPLDEIDALLAAEGQRLACEPPDFTTLLGVSSRPTIGGVIATNLAGSRRLTAGAVRDQFLGFEAVSGKGERFRAGGRVVKNVTGYDLPKLLAGSWGTLAVMTEVSVRVAPAPETEQTLVFDDRTPEEALATMTAALGSSFDVTAAAFDPWRGTALRVEGFAASVASRREALARLLAREPADILPPAGSAAFWRAFGNVDALADWPVVWRISVPPAAVLAVLTKLEPERYLLDWGGGLIWLAAGAVDIGRVRGSIGEGHATLFKAPAADRVATCVRQASSAAVAALGERIRHAFDPDGRLNPGRMD